MKSGEVGRLMSLALLLSAPAVAAETQAQQLTGRVESISADTLVLHTARQGRVRVALRSGTRYMRDQAAATRSVVKPGTEVMVHARREGRRWVAESVHILATTGAEATAHAGHVAEAPADVTHAGHAETAPAAGDHASHGGMGPGPPMQHGAMPGQPMEPRHDLFQSDMTLMAGMTPRDPMGGMAMPRWEWMAMGIARLAYNRQGGPSGDTQVESTNWNMVMGQRDLGGGRLTLMLMNSLEPGTIAKRGSPELFQTGETFEGRPLVDHQHPHDLFMNLSATYRRPVGDQAVWWVQAAVRGEPALGPTAYMHRASGGENPSAVLGHHLQDSTHITDDVLTVGGGWRWLTLEASAFHGAEPDENRWDLDPGGLDSASARVKVSLTSGWSGQVSYGFLKNPEALQPGDVHRTTASLHYGERGDRPLAASLVWGRNREEHGRFDSWLLEGAYQATGRDQFWARGERADKDRDLLELKRLDAHHAGRSPIAAVRALTVGYLHDFVLLRELKVLRDLNAGVGGDLTFYGVPDELKSAYGDTPVSVHVFARFRWGRPHAGGSHGASH